MRASQIRRVRMAERFMLTNLGVRPDY